MTNEEHEVRGQAEANLCQSRDREFAEAKLHVYCNDVSLSPEVYAEQQDNHAEDAAITMAADQEVTIEAGSSNGKGFSDLPITGYIGEMCILLQTDNTDHSAVQPPIDESEERAKLLLARVKSLEQANREMPITSYGRANSIETRRQTPLELPVTNRKVVEADGQIFYQYIMPHPEQVVIEELAADILEEAFGEFIAGEFIRARLDDSYFDNTEITEYVFSKSGATVGIVYDPHSRILRDNKLRWMDKLGTKPSHQGKGEARRLVLALSQKNGLFWRSAPDNPYNRVYDSLTVAVNRSTSLHGDVGEALTVTNQPSVHQPKKRWECRVLHPPSGKPYDWAVLERAYNYAASLDETIFRPSNERY